MAKPDTAQLHIIFSGRRAAVIRQTARAWGATYASVVRKAVNVMMDDDGGRTISVPFGEKDFADCVESKHECEGECKCK